MRRMTIFVVSALAVCASCGDRRAGAPENQAEPIGSRPALIGRPTSLEVKVAGAARIPEAFVGLVEITGVRIVDAVTREPCPFQGCAFEERTGAVVSFVLVKLYHGQRPDALLDLGTCVKRVDADGREISSAELCERVFVPKAIPGERAFVVSSGVPKNRLFDGQVIDAYLHVKGDTAEGGLISGRKELVRVERAIVDTIHLSRSASSSPSFDGREPSAGPPRLMGSDAGP